MGGMCGCAAQHRAELDRNLAWSKARLHAGSQRGGDPGAEGPGASEGAPGVEGPSSGEVASSGTTTPGEGEESSTVEEGGTPVVRVEERPGSITPAPGEGAATTAQRHPVAILRGIPGMGEWAVWISSFRSEAKAQTEIESLLRRGFQARSFPVEIPSKGLWYRVYVGNYSTRAIANEARALLLEERSIDFAQVRHQPFSE